jgi:subtilisin family serine protease
VNAAKAIRYAADNGARVINWSGSVNSMATEEDLATLKEAIDYAGSKGVLLVTGAGNDGKNLDLEANARYPQCFDCDNILNVAEITLAGELDEKSGRDRVSSSAWGVKRVGIAAIARTFTTHMYNVQSTYMLGGGTSCAAPVVTGVAALVLSVRPDLDYRDLKEILMASARPLPALEGKVTSGGMVDACAAVRMAIDHD